LLVCSTPDEVFFERNFGNVGAQQIKHSVNKTIKFLRTNTVNPFVILIEHSSVTDFSAKIKIIIIII